MLNYEVSGVIKSHLVEPTLTIPPSSPVLKPISEFYRISPDAPVRSLTIHFVGYEALKESDFGLECAGNLNGSEASGYWKESDRLPLQHFTLTKKN